MEVIYEIFYRMHTRVGVGWGMEGSGGGEWGGEGSVGGEWGREGSGEWVGKGVG